MVAQSFLKRVHSLLAPLYGYAKRRRRTVLGIEPLEDRTLLTASLEIAIEGPSPVSGFATSVATTEQYFIVGSPSSGTANSGQAFVYEVGTGALVHTLNNPAGGAGDQFGYSVAVSGNNIVVGSPFYDSGTKSQDQDVGRMYLFDLTTGGLLQTLDNPDPEPDDQFGASVDISGTLIVGGAAHHSTPQNDAGAVHVFDTSGAFLRTINNPEPHPNDHFGTDVSIDGNLIAVGEVFDNTGAEDAGSVYILDATNGTLLYELRNPFPTTNDYFGHAVTISGNLVVAAVEGDEVGAANNAGSVYVFDLGSMTPTTYALHIQNPNPTTGDHFGHSLEIDGTNLVIGANLSNIGGDDTGVAYVYDIGVLNPTPTVPVCTIENPDHNPGDQFGESVAITGMAVIVGANLHDNLTLGTLGDDLGAVYAYRLDPAEALLKLEPRHRHLLETTIMNGTLKVSDIVVSSLVPDGYTLGLAGPDAGIFDIVGTELILKAGTVFDFETKTTYTVDVTLDSPLIPSMPGEPDATDTFTLHLIDVLERPEVQVAVNGTEVYDNGTVNFGEAAVFDAPPTRTFVVRNDGIADLILQPLSIPGGFTLLSPNFTPGQIVAPGAQTSFTLQMNTDTLGLKAGVLTFANNDPDAAEANYNIKLTG
ncbi:MAG: choice-of-anchor D domain-containing protein, partial [Planctomycetaceae bacterium]|nr:choice-of-anchor D domain-containing protein [Planctomycetaceae bacterium]